MKHGRIPTRLKTDIEFLFGLGYFCPLIRGKKAKPNTPKFITGYALFAMCMPKESIKTTAYFFDAIDLCLKIQYCVAVAVYMM